MIETISLLKTVQTSTMTASFRSDEVVQLVIDANSHTKVPEVIEAINAIKESAGGKRCPLLVIAGKDASIDTAAMSYMAKNTSESTNTAIAFLIGSISQKLLGNFYLSFNKPLKPTRIFTNIEDALEWLYPFRA
jgi:hypothetical protein